MLNGIIHGMAMIALRYLLASYFVIAPAVSVCCALCPEQPGDMRAARCSCCKPATAKVASCCSSTPEQETANGCECCFERPVPVTTPYLPLQARVINPPEPTDLLLVETDVQAVCAILDAWQTDAAWPSILKQSGQSLFCVWRN